MNDQLLNVERLKDEVKNLRSKLAEMETQSLTKKWNLRLDEIEKQAIIETWKRLNYNKTHTAKALGIGIRTVQRKLLSYGYKAGYKPVMVQRIGFDHEPHL